MTEPTTAPIRKGLLPCTPPPEWEFHTVLGAREEGGGVALFPGGTGPVVVRRRVSYGDWEPVRPDRWADEPSTAVSSAGVVQLPPTNQAALRDRIAEALYPTYGQQDRNRSLAIADAVLSVLPAPVDRAAVLLEAADAVFALDYDVMVGEEGEENLGSMREAWDLGTIDADSLLRRMAAEAPATEEQAAVRRMLTRTQGAAATHDLDHLLRLLARWTASSEGRDVLVEELIAAGYRLPHACGNCDGVDPDSCLTNPDRAAVVQPAQPHNDETPGSDPIETSTEAALGQAEERLRQILAVAEVIEANGIAWAADSVRRAAKGELS